MVAFVPLNEAMDIIQNWITKMFKQKTEIENNSASPPSLPHMYVS